MNRCLARALSVGAGRVLWSRAVQCSPVLLPHQKVSSPPLSIQLSAQFSSDPGQVQQKIDGFVKNSKVVVFMKGVPTAPQCGFSNAVVQIMRYLDMKI